MKFKNTVLIVLSVLSSITCSSLAFAASDLAPKGSELDLLWIMPFAGLLLSIALVPLIANHFWENHFGKVIIFWILCFLIPALFYFGFHTTLYIILHTLFLEYIPYIVLLVTLFVVAGGIRVKGTFVGTPLVNTFILFLGSILASFMGTTGAAVLFIRPLLRANAHRMYRVHTVMFFIFLVGNIAGSLTPLGDPPLFMGFLKGVPFFWPFKYLLSKTVFLVTTLLFIYFIVDNYFYKKEDLQAPDDEGPKEKFAVDGKINFLFLIIVVILVFQSGYWNPNVTLAIWSDVGYLLQDAVRDLGLIAVLVLSLKLTSTITRRGNSFTWGPILEVIKIFLGIFITMYPVITILQAGEEGVLGQVVTIVTNADGSPNNTLYFWVTGALSSFLDNVPTYLVFFNIASTTYGLDALITDIPQTLAALSAGTVFMGTVTYISNAPNFMIKAIADEQGVKMPSFFGYTFWTLLILTPLYVVLTTFFFK